ncbi:MAG: hypothetical protein ACFCUE_13135 [Candidatus Bathyarchaeia archaeon]|jgi:multisubunit Na+/H+ antiporter MnhG subunit
MTNYHKASTVNLVVGVALILFGVVGIASNNFASSNLFSQLFLLVFVLIGGYETGKYAEMRHEKIKTHAN